jgi:succinate dehydrogenase/fumarate reductase cytochrome b subunit
MDMMLRIIAIVIEVVILTAIAYTLLNGVRLAALDLGIKAKFNKAMIVVFCTVGAIAVIFFIAHLITFYPAV